ncbi:MAG: hypothetical protein WCI88_07065 [Chloroflexota bacterium]|jgi:hypothetical protein
MKLLQSKVRKVVARKGWSEKMFIAQCIMADISHQTARDVYAGSTGLTTETLAKIAIALGVTSVAEVLDLSDEVLAELGKKDAA